MIPITPELAMEHGRTVVQLLKAFEPRRIPKPSDNYFGSLDVATVFMEAHIVMLALTQQGRELTLANQVLWLTSVVAADYMCPLYYVGREFFQAVATSKLPEDFDLSKVHWPFPCISFALPISESTQLLGRKITMVTAARIAPAVYPTAAGKFPHHDFEVQVPSAMTTATAIEVRDDGGGNMCYASSLRDNHKISDLLSVPFQQGYKFKIGLGGCEIDGAAPELGEEQFATVVSELAIKLLVSMTVSKGLIEEGVMTRKARVKHGKKRDALWSPNWIGRTYRVKHDYLGGTHASPRMHWRCGHWRNQAVGKGRSDHRLIWIEPMLISAQ